MLKFAVLSAGALALLVVGRVVGQLADAIDVMLADAEGGDWLAEQPTAADLDALLADSDGELAEQRISKVQRPLIGGTSCTA